MFHFPKLLYQGNKVRKSFISLLKFECHKWHMRHTHRHHGLSPLSMSPLQHFDSLCVTADLYQVAHSKVGGRGGPFTGSRGPCCGSTGTGSSVTPTGTIGIHLCQHSWIEGPSADNKISVFVESHNYANTVYFWKFFKLFLQQHSLEQTCSLFPIGAWSSFHYYMSNVNKLTKVKYFTE